MNSILLIDALNLFSRHYVRNPAMSTHGHQAGGIVGFLNTLGLLVQQIHPSAVYVVWEGGGSSRRKSIFPEYKQNRRPPKLNRYYEDDIPDSNENRIHQIKFLVECLKHAPMCQLFVEGCEADDVIGYLCRNKFKDEKKIIVSSDRDYFQLLDVNTIMYSLTSKKFLGPDDVLKEFNITPENFVLAKAICGDPSDNIPGVKGVGFKTVAKRFKLSSDAITIQDILETCKNSGSKSHKIYSQIYESEDLIKRNWRLMYLDVSNLAALQMRRIDSTVESFKPVKNKMQLMKMLHDEGLPTFNVQELFSSFTLL